MFYHCTPFRNSFMHKIIWKRALAWGFWCKKISIKLHLILNNVKKKHCKKNRQQFQERPIIRARSHRRNNRLLSFLFYKLFRIILRFILFCILKASKKHASIFSCVWMNFGLKVCNHKIYQKVRAKSCLTTKRLVYRTDYRSWWCVKRHAVKLKF